MMLQAEEGCRLATVEAAAGRTELGPLYLILSTIFKKTTIQKILPLQAL